MVINSVWNLIRPASDLSSFIPLQVHDHPLAIDLHQLHCSQVRIKSMFDGLLLLVTPQTWVCSKTTHPEFLRE